MTKIDNTDFREIDIEAIAQAIRELESPKTKRDRERAEFFSTLYPDIRDQLNGGISKSAILKRLADHGVLISTQQFEQLLSSAASRRGEPMPFKARAASHENQGFRRAMKTRAEQDRGELE